MSLRRMLVTLLVGGGLLGVPMSAAVLAQEASGWSDAIAADAVVSGEGFVEGHGIETAGALDLLAGWQPGARTLISGRPVLRRTLDGDWSADLLQLAARHDFEGPVRLRVEGGWLPSPIGLAPLESRASENPMVAPITAYTAALPPFEVGAPGVQLSSPLYPLAVQATAATNVWDARVALLESSLVRVRPLTGDDRGPRAAQVAVGGGVTPHIGLRLGSSLAYGRYASANEVVDQQRGDRQALIVGVDGDYSVRYTRVYGEWIRTAFERATDTAVATSTTVTAAQTLSPRWYVAGRGQYLTTSNLIQASSNHPYGAGDHGHVEAYVTPAGYGHEDTAPWGDGLPLSGEWLDTGAATALSLETTVGYRLSPRVTLKGGYLGYRSYGEDGIEHHLTVAMVWTGRWP